MLQFLCSNDTIPAFAQTQSGAILEDCFGRAQLDGSRKRVLALRENASARSPREVMCMLRGFMMALGEMDHSTSWDEGEGALIYTTYVTILALVQHPRGLFVHSKSMIWELSGSRATH